MTLKEWRRANRYTQAAFARLLSEKNGIDVDRTNVWHWENGTTPRRETISAIHAVTRGKVKAADFARGQTVAGSEAK